MNQIGGQQIHNIRFHIYIYIYIYEVYIYTYNIYVALFSSFMTFCLFVFTDGLFDLNPLYSFRNALKSLQQPVEKHCTVPFTIYKILEVFEKLWWCYREFKVLCTERLFLRVITHKKKLLCPGHPKILDAKLFRKVLEISS